MPASAKRSGDRRGRFGSRLSAQTSSSCSRGPLDRGDRQARADKGTAALFLRADQKGFSLLELLVASFMSVMVVGGMLLILDGLRDLHRDQQQLIDAQMTARLSLEQMERDIQLAGIGLRGLLAPLPVIEPRLDGGIDVRYNTNNLTARLNADMSGAASFFPVDDATGFVPGMVVAVYDGTGAFDMTTLTNVQPGELHHNGGISKSYRQTDGTAIKRVQTTSFQVLPVNGTLTILRQEDGNPPLPIAINVRSINITYFNDANPPQAFVPVTAADQLRVRAIEITLEVETEDVRLNTTDEQTASLTIRITPRAGLLTS